MLSQEGMQELANSFMDKYCKDENARFRSYDHAHKAFRDGLYNVTVSDDELAKDLFVFLASWGMLRGSSRYLNKDYKFFVRIIPVLRKSDYRFLMDVNPFTVDKNKYVGAVCTLKNELNKKLCNKSDILVTKILLAVFGCIPAYDKFVKKTFGSLSISQKLNENGLKNFFDWVCNHKDDLNSVASDVNKKIDTGVTYSVMKIVDMIFWQSGSKS